MEDRDGELNELSQVGRGKMAVYYSRSVLG